MSPEVGINFQEVSEDKRPTGTRPTTAKKDGDVNAAWERNPLLWLPEAGNAAKIENFWAPKSLGIRESWDFPPVPACPGGPGDEDPGGSSRGLL